MLSAPTDAIIQPIQRTPFEIRHPIRHKRSLKRRWQKSHSSTDKHLLNSASQKLKRILRTYRNEYLENKLASLTSTKATDFSLWKTIKCRKRPLQHIPP